MLGAKEMTTTKLQDALLNAWLGWHKKAEESGAFGNPSIPFEQGFNAAWEARQVEIDCLQKYIDELPQI